MLVYVGVGTNLGDRWANLAFAARSLKAEPRLALVRASRVYDTAPIGPPQPRYLNAVLEAETTMAAQAFFAVLQMAENAARRKRTGVRWAARTLDLDLLLFGDEVIRRPPALIVPHPEIQNRRFVLAPLAELCPERVVPGTGQTVAQLLSRAPQGEVVCAGMYPT